MKTQIKKELHAKSLLELKKQLKDVKDEVRSLRLDKEMGKLKNSSSLSLKRAEIAVIKTIINEKSIEGKHIKITKEDDKNKKPVAVKAIAGKGGKK